MVRGRKEGPVEMIYSNFPATASSLRAAAQDPACPTGF